MECENTAIVYTKPNCPNCVQAKALLTNKKYCIEEKVIGVDATIEDLFEHIGQQVRSVPQIFIKTKHLGDAYIGDYTALQQFLK